MNFGRISEAPCVTVSTPTDERCSDPAFALAFPEICPQEGTGGSGLVIKPAFAVACALGSVQFKLFKVTNGEEEEILDGFVFSSSNLNVAMIGAATGSATGVYPGSATITATYEGATAHAEMDVVACDDPSAGCNTQHVGVMVLMDVSKSMGLSFPGYVSRLGYAKQAAQRFIGEIDGTKDYVGLITFDGTDHTVESALTASTATVAAAAAAVTGTQNKTEFFEALTEAVAQLEAIPLDRKVILILSDGEDTSGSYTDLNNPYQAAFSFKSAGGVILALGCRASGKGFKFLNSIASGGFFINAYSGTAETALDYICGLKGYLCAANCTPAGDVITHSGALEYTSFLNWDVTAGSVDLQGNRFFDILSESGLYVNLMHSPATGKGKLVTKSTYALTGGRQYTLVVYLAGNQVVNLLPYSARVRVYRVDGGGGELVLLDRIIGVSNYMEYWTAHNFTFDAPGDMEVYISVEQWDIPATGDIRPGLLLGEVDLFDSVLAAPLFQDDFNAENAQYIPPGCGQGTTYTWLGDLNAYGYATGYECDAIECLEDPPDTQLPDPSPLADIESGTPPSQTYTATATVCRSCDDLPGKTVSLTDADGNVANLIPLMTDHTLPSGEAAASSESGNYPAWAAFKTPPTLVPGQASVPANGMWQSDLNTPIGSANGNTVRGILTYDFGQKVAATKFAVTVHRVIGAAKIAKLYASNVQVYPNAAVGSLIGLQAFNGVLAGTATLPGTYAETAPADRVEFELEAAAYMIGYRYWSLVILDVAGRLAINPKYDPVGAPDEAYLIWEEAGYPVSVARLELLGPTEDVTPTNEPVCRTASATSTESQQHALALAQKEAERQALAALDCGTLYEANASATVQCPPGSLGPAVTRSAHATSYVSEDDARQKAEVLAHEAAQAVVDADCTACNNTQPITINDRVGALPAPASPYPSVWYNADEFDPSAMTVTVDKLSHNYPGDVHIVLVSPDGVAVALMRNCGGANVTTDAVIVFDDAASGSLPEDAALTSGTYKPTQYGVEVDLISPGPAGPYATALSAFAGCETVGAWSLWIMDDSAGEGGTISLGWHIDAGVTPT